MLQSLPNHFISFSFRPHLRGGQDREASVFKCKVHRWTVSLRKPHLRCDPKWPPEGTGKGTHAVSKELPAPLWCAQFTVYLFPLFIYLFLLRLPLSCTWSISHYLISASQKKNLKKGAKVCSSEGASTQHLLRSARMTLNLPPLFSKAAQQILELIEADS